MPHEVLIKGSHAVGPDEFCKGSEFVDIAELLSSKGHGALLSQGDERTLSLRENDVAGRNPTEQNVAIPAGVSCITLRLLNLIFYMECLADSILYGMLG